MRDYPRSAISRDRTYYNNRTRRRLTVLSPPGSPSCPWRLILRVVNWSSHLVATPCSKVSILTDMMLFCRLDDLRQHQSFVQDMTVQWYWEIPQMFDNSLSVRLAGVPRQLNVHDVNVMSSGGRPLLRTHHSQMGVSS